MDTIDLRSDTVTKPTEAMRRAMAEAEVGDDVYGEDPTVNRLERRAAEIFEKEAALFLPTGTMGNQTAVRLHTEHGQEVICERRAHIVDWEMAAVSAFSGCQLRQVEGERGVLRLGAHCGGDCGADLLPRADGADCAREHPQHGGRHGDAAGGARGGVGRCGRTRTAGAPGWSDGSSTRQRRQGCRSRSSHAVLRQ